MSFDPVVRLRVVHLRRAESLPRSTSSGSIVASYYTPGSNRGATRSAMSAAWRGARAWSAPGVRAVAWALGRRCVRRWQRRSAYGTAADRGRSLGPPKTCARRGGGAGASAARDSGFAGDTELSIARASTSVPSTSRSYRSVDVAGSRTRAHAGGVEAARAVRLVDARIAIPIPSWDVPSLLYWAMASVWNQPADTFHSALGRIAPEVDARLLAVGMGTVVHRNRHGG